MDGHADCVLMTPVGLRCCRNVSGDGFEEIDPNCWAFRLRKLEQSESVTHLDLSGCGNRIVCFTLTYLANLK